jgi:hypothetical protein
MNLGAAILHSTLRTIPLATRIGASRERKIFVAEKPYSSSQSHHLKVSKSSLSRQGNSDYLDQCEIQVDRGSGWQVLTFHTTPFPATPTKWTYRAIYRVDNQQVSQ